MSNAIQSGEPRESLLRFARREPVQLDPDLKAFLDDVIVPTLIRQAMEEIQNENLIELNEQSVEDCARNSSDVEASL